MSARPYRVASALCLLTVSALAAYFSLRLAWADQLCRGESRSEVSRAARLAPGDAACRMRLATLEDRDGEDPTPALLQAAALDPLDYHPWLELGLRSEQQRDLAAAERYFLEAAAASRQFQPRWMLANFYFRHARLEPFRRWTREALLIDPGDPSQLFKLCWTLSPDGPAILAQAIPGDRRILSSYLKFLVAENRLDDAQLVAGRLLECAEPADTPIMLVYADRLLDAQRVAPALDLWNGLCRRALVPYPARDETALVNGALDRQPLGAAFDWRIYRTPGVSTWPLSPGLRVAFTGKQPETCEPLAQVIPVEPGRGYRLQFEYRTSGIPAGSGLRWRIYDGFGPTEIPSRSAELSSDSWTTEEVRFSVPPGVRLARLALRDQREPGATRIEGSLDLRRVVLLSNP